MKPPKKVLVLVYSEPNLKNRNNVTPETISKMVGFFARHEKNKGIKPENAGKPYNDKA